jgi:hypothetical protein
LRRYYPISVWLVAAAASGGKESRLSESNRRPVHYEKHARQHQTR